MIPEPAEVDSLFWLWPKMLRYCSMDTLVTWTMAGITLAAIVATSVVPPSVTTVCDRGPEEELTLAAVRVLPLILPVR